MDLDFLMGLFSSDGFMPHVYCYSSNTRLVWLHVVSDALISLAYMSIPFTLIYFVRKRRDLVFSWMFVLFGLFIIACGFTHVMEIWTLWRATYWLSGVVKAATALASVPTAVLLIQLVPRALAIPSPEALRHEIAHLLAQSRAGHRRILPHGVEWQQACQDLRIGNEKRCHTLPFPVCKRVRRYLYKCPNCQCEFPRVRRARRAVACLECCRAHNGGEFDARFRLRLVSIR